MNRNFPLFNKAESAEEKIANIIVGHSQIDEALGLFILGHFFKITKDKNNKTERLQFESFILSKVGNREKIEAVYEIMGEPKDKVFKKSLMRLAEIRNSVAHDTMYASGKLVANMSGRPDLDSLYSEFTEIMTRFEEFIESVHTGYMNDLNYLYEQD